MAVTDVLTLAELIARVPDAATWPAVPTEAVIVAVSQHLETLTGAYFVQRAYHEYRPAPSGRPPVLVLLARPVVSISSVTDLGGTVVDPALYTLVAERGLVYLHEGVRAPAGLWDVALVGGWFVDTASVAEDVKQAAILLIERRMASLLSTTAEAAAPVDAIRVGDLSLSYGDLTAAADDLFRRVVALVTPYMGLKVR